MSPEIHAVIDAARSGDAHVLFDIDDLMFNPELATSESIDGIRSQHLALDDVADHCGRVRATLALADYCIATTEPLARQSRALGKTTFVLPNGFDAATHAASRRAVRRVAPHPMTA